MLIPMIDYLAFTVDVEDYQERILDYFSTLQEAKESAKLLSAEKSSEKITVCIGNIVFEVLANGANGFAFILNNDLCQVKLAQYRSTNQDFYPIMVIIHSQCLWAFGPEESFFMISKWITQTFGNIIANKASRVDLCCHNDLIKGNELALNSFKGTFKSNNHHSTHRKTSGIDFGKRESKIFCRIYDKLLEVNTKRNKLWFYEIWSENGYSNKEIWNVEFELKRNFFISYNLESVEDVFSSLKSIWDFCTKEWLVMIDRDHTRVENCSVSPIWQEISDAFSKFSSKPLIARQKQLVADANALIPSTVGYLTTVAARLGCDDIDAVWGNIKANGTDYLASKDHSYKTKIGEKIDLLGNRK